MIAVESVEHGYNAALDVKSAISISAEGIERHARINRRLDKH